MLPIFFYYIFLVHFLAFLASPNVLGSFLACPLVSCLFFYLLSVCIFFYVNNITYHLANLFLYKKNFQ
ncbi:hypothetical protein GLOIN_2v1656311 [Rhizophagus irregularis DAOM 181602=DAOM 197198]|uniref:Uncharacterized protein n=1 Tax=Rhizophagus irregularis (strain DAOM 181602 / DAOM 197198 / MUCL 43194) TaxID=747089 RepID=A0A2P4PMD1_RHIID|nr:hypothetical protein GLOIN_2v1656311 [Rhizophagus irregularis DAOM 181602=DAOM 197198]POG66530.1 hypothetical protein GLOIN_2v1656311 [Rhizophagus irregularis DAOM 181602=DAOM 197198]GET56852.1 hypothetical protein GLOIN_2v1656311 [Rhizophagus irregularis DAOM 181602=DAOM 197198]|eukprot:XP_025173396.1 hypothetical protein GLOIN_2v1656311 [Rhizophagus irregularis DAOM 181602=DAOM 197198]